MENFTEYDHNKAEEIINSKASDILINLNGLTYYQAMKVLSQAKDFFERMPIKFEVDLSSK